MLQFGELRRSEGRVRTQRHGPLLRHRPVRLLRRRQGRIFRDELRRRSGENVRLPANRRTDSQDGRRSIPGD